MNSNQAQLANQNNKETKKRDRSGRDQTTRPKRRLIKCWQYHGKFRCNAAQSDQDAMAKHVLTCANYLPAAPAASSIGDENEEIDNNDDNNNDYEQGNNHDIMDHSVIGEQDNLEEDDGDVSLDDILMWLENIFDVIPKNEDEQLEIYNALQQYSNSSVKPLTSILEYQIKWRNLFNPDNFKTSPLRLKKMLSQFIKL